jgi:type II secretory pathway component GspD/PulD (secretin)
VIFGTFITFSYAEEIEIKAYKTRLSEVMEEIGKQVKKKITLNTDKNPLVSFGSKESNLEDTLKKIQNLYGFGFDILDEEIVVSDSFADRGLAAVEEVDPTNLSPLELRQSGFRFRSVYMNGLQAATVLTQVQQILGEDLKFAQADAKNNAIVFYGNDETYKTVRQIVDDLDIQPRQILLSAKIIEASNSFSRELGSIISRAAGPDKGNFIISNPGAADNIVMDYKFGIIDSTGLSATIAAGESRGDAKIISNPQVITTDNIAATLNSGLNFSVRVSSAGTGGVVAGGLQSVSAGLDLSVTPKILRDDRISLKLSISSSEVDTGSSVDGIPGISSTSVTTEMVVREGQTAAIAGIYKHTDNKSNSGIPGFMNIPIFGYLFKNDSKTDVLKEIMAFISPAMIDPGERSIKFNSPTKKSEIEKTYTSR